MTNINDVQSPEEFAEVWDKTHITNKLASNVRQQDIRNYVEQLRAQGLKTSEVGRSFGGREIYGVEWGSGKTKILMWSQMHGDEPTATSALMDMFAFLQSNHRAWIEKLEETVTIRAVPMLNPDGAELFQRRNLQFIDINRDARRLETPEGKILKRLREEWKPDIGFNLHNQQELTTVGETFDQATNSFLAVSGREDGTSYPGHEKNKRICAVMINALRGFIGKNIGRYDDSYDPRAFGDMISASGTPVILIETGGCHGKDEMFLVRLNFIAYLSALQSLVDGTAETANGSDYDNLPLNSSGKIYNFMFRNARVIDFAESDQPFVADIAINRERRRANQTPPVFVMEIGDLNFYRGLDEYDVSDYNVVVESGHLKLGSNGDLLFYKRDRMVDWKAKNLKKEYPPDGEFLNGTWMKRLDG
jgi:hypothetical protein